MVSTSSSLIVAPTLLLRHTTPINVGTVAMLVTLRRTVGPRSRNNKSSLIYWRNSTSLSIRHILLMLKTILTVIHLEENMVALDLDQEPTWYLDSTASSHLTSDKSQLTKFVPCSFPSSLTTTSGHRLPVVGKGKVVLGKNKTISNVLYVSDAIRNLVSIGKLVDAGHIITFDARSYKVVHSRTPQLIAFSGIRTSTNGLYCLRPSRLPALSPIEVYHFT